MKLSSVLRPVVKKATFLLLGLLFAFIAGSCHADDNEIKITTLNDIQWDVVKASVFLNDMHIEDARVQVRALPGSDSISMTLTGLHPTDAIELAAVATLDDNGDIVFRGEKLHEEIRYLKIYGTLCTNLINVATHIPSFKVNVTYRIPDNIASETCFFTFGENNGLCYQRYTNMESSSEADSLTLISDRINSELAKHLQSIAFSFKADGMMSVQYTDSKDNTHRQSFRYWVSKQDWSGDNIIDIEDPDRFYDTLLKALIPLENQCPGILPYQIQEKTARLFIHKYQNLLFSKSVVLLGDFHQKIFSYLYDYLLTDGSWTDTENACFLLMERQTERFSREDDPTFYQTYTWAFSTVTP